MDERLTLGIPDQDAPSAPKKRFEIKEKATRLNSLAALPLLVIAFAAALKEMFKGEEEEEPGKRHGSARPDQTPDMQPASGMPIEAIETGEAADVDRVVRISDYLDALAKGRPLPVFDVSQFALAQAGEVAFQAAVARAMETPPAPSEAARPPSGQFPGQFPGQPAGELPGQSPSAPIATANDNRPGPPSAPDAGGDPLAPPGDAPTAGPGTPRDARNARRTAGRRQRQRRQRRWRQ